jgi:hypothetical protein
MFLRVVLIAVFQDEVDNYGGFRFGRKSDEAMEEFSALLHPGLTI